LSGLGATAFKNEMTKLEKGGCCTAGGTTFFQKVSRSKSQEKEERQMEEKDKDVMMRDGEGASKRDLLKVLGAGLGIAGLTSMMGGQSFADVEKKGKYVIVITHGGDDPNRAIFGLLMAQVVADKGWGKVHVWMTLDGADLVNTKKTERIESPIYKKFGNALEIMKKIKDKGGSFGVCPPCAEYFGATGSDKYDWVELAGGDWLMKNIQDAWVLWI
jgi:predicted peroxiredoxin